MASPMWRRICLVLPIAIGGLLTLAPVAGAAESDEKEVSNQAWAAPLEFGYVSVKCPSSHPYLLGVKAQANNAQTGLTTFTPSNYPGVSKLSFSNNNERSNPAKNVWVSLTSLCSKSAPTQAPSFQVTRTQTVPGKIGDIDGVVSSELNCPFNYPKINADYYAGPSGTNNLGSRDYDSIPQRQQVIWWNGNDKAVNVTWGIVCGLLPI